MLISDRIFQILKEKSISQKEFSVRTGIPQSTISDWKSKRLNPASDKIMVICRVLEVSPSELLEGASDEKWNMDGTTLQKDSEDYILLEQIRSLPAESRSRLMGYLDALLGK